jgi:hypothetical protein
LNLSATQRGDLSSFIQDAIAGGHDAREARAEGASEIKPLLERYLREVRANGEPSAGTVEAIRGFRTARRAGREDRIGEREAMRSRLKEILTEDQLRVMASFRPMASVGPDEEQMQARERRRGERRERFDAFADKHDLDDTTVDRMQRRSRRGHAKRKGKKTIKRILVSPEMLEVLSR